MKNKNFFFRFTDPLVALISVIIVLAVYLVLHFTGLEETINNYLF